MSGRALLLQSAVSTVALGVACNAYGHDRTDLLFAMAALGIVGEWALRAWWWWRGRGEVIR